MRFAQECANAAGRGHQPRQPGCVLRWNATESRHCSHEVMLKDEPALGLFPQSFEALGASDDACRGIQGDDFVSTGNDHAIQRRTNGTGRCGNDRRLTGVRARAVTGTVLDLLFVVRGFHGDSCLSGAD
jgi:hypothetical protein